MTEDRSAERYKVAQILIPEAFKDAFKKYPNDVEGALIFFMNAVGLTIVDVTEDDIKWAQEQVKTVELETGKTYD